MKRSHLISLFFAASLAVVAVSQTPPPQAPPGARRGVGPGGLQGIAGMKPSEPKKYEDVITKEAKSQSGVFKVDRINDKVYWEIPTGLMGRVFLWQAELAELPHRVSFPGSPLGTKVIRFSRHNNTVFVHDCNFTLRSFGPDKGFQASVAEDNIEPVIASFNVEAEAPDKAAVIDVTSLFSNDSSILPASGRYGLGGVDPSKSYIDTVKDFPANIETRAMLTYGVGTPTSRRTLGFGGGGEPATVLVHTSLDLLPSVPMRGRYKDTRIGYFTEDFTEYGRTDNRADDKEYIDRFRLEKKDPKADVSEPIKPIVFYLPKEIPAKWRPYIKEGIEDWQPVFEKAGFKNAIQCKDAPNDPEWDPEDARYNVIRWAPSITENARGASIHDPRSGETLSAHAIFWNGLIKLLEDWSYSQIGAIDPKVRLNPIPDERVGRMLRYVVEHEIGHTLGLEHNFRASTAYTVKQLRSPSFMKDHGSSASVMSYSRNDYVAQAGDGVDPDDTANRIGPYDYFAIEYGYKDIPKAPTPDLEKPALDALLAKQIENPELRFGNYLYTGIDPGMQNENISDDPVEAGKLGLHNIYEIADSYLLPTTTPFGEDYSRTEEMEQSLMEQRLTELLHATVLVGGVVQTDYHAGRGSEVFAPVSTKEQAAAVNFVTTYGLATPSALVRPEIMNRLEPDGIVNSVAGQNALLLYVLLAPGRVQRLEDNEAQSGARAYTVAQLVNDVSKATWSELDQAMPQVDVYRRQLQRTYLQLMDTKINGDSASGSDVKSLEKDDLKHVAHRIDLALARTRNHVTSAHLQACRVDIERILDNKYSSPSFGGGLDLSFLLGIKPGEPLPTFDDDDCFAPNQTIVDAVRQVQKEYPSLAKGVGEKG
jgi:hypothetical protein